MTTTQRTHPFAARVVWEGNRGAGTADYTSYGRAFRVLVAGRPELQGSADPAFLGEPDKHNPEDLFLASISACHMLTYLALCARHGVGVVAYEDDATGTLRLDAGGGGRFEEVTLRPRVTLARAGDAARAASLHGEAHARCFIARSCATPIRHQASVVAAEREVAP